MPELLNSTSPSHITPAPRKLNAVLAVQPQAHDDAVKIRLQVHVIRQRASATKKRRNADEIIANGEIEQAVRVSLGRFLSGGINAQCACDDGFAFAQDSRRSE